MQYLHQSRGGGGEADFCQNRFKLMNLNSGFRINVFLFLGLEIRATSCLVFSVRYAQREQIIYRVEFTRKKCKTAILLYCFHTAGVLHIFVLFNLLGPGTYFFRKKSSYTSIEINLICFFFIKKHVTLQPVGNQRGKTVV